MSPEEPKRIPVRVSPDELAPEAIPTLPVLDILPVDPRQADRLKAFHNVLKTVFDAEQYEREQRRPNRYGTIENGKISETHMIMNSRYRSTWNHVAESMYRTELTEDEVTRQAANEIRAKLKLEYDGPPAMTAEEAEALFRR